MNEPAFLDAILCEPDEITHRLVYADWLEDHGDDPSRDRATFIRAQIERASLPAYHPRVRCLLREEQALCERYAAIWAKDVIPLVRAYQFRRGFIEHVRITAEQLVNNGPRLFALAPLRSIQLRGTMGLQSLLDNNPAAFTPVTALLPRLREIDLTREYLGEAVGMALLDLPRPLRLTGLRLAHNTLTAAGINALANSAVLESLEFLEVTTSASAVDALHTLLYSPRLAKLRSLSLAGGRLGDRAIRLLVRSPLLPHLHTLNLSHNQILTQGLRSLVTSPEAAHLESLDLSFNEIGCDGVDALNRWEGVSRLRHLNLSRTTLGDAGAEAVASGPLLGRLEAIDLSLNHMNDRGGNRLANFPGESGLLLVDLIYNRLSASVRNRLVARFGEDVCLFKR